MMSVALYSFPTPERCIPALRCRLREETSGCRSLRTSTGVRGFLPCFGIRAISPANAANAHSSRFVEAHAPGHTPSTQTCSARILHVSTAPLAPVGVRKDSLEPLPEEGAVIEEP